MFKVQTLNTISIKGLEQFPQALYNVSSDCVDPDALIVRSYDLHTMVIPGSVKVVGRAGAGVNNIPVTQLTEKGIPVLNTPGANANAVRELVIAGMLLASRNIYQALDYMSHLKTNEAELNTRIEQDKKQFVGFEILGKTIGVIGLGSIGVKVANAAMGLGMQVIGYDPTISVNRAWELSSDVKQARSVDELLAESDFVTLHVPLTEETQNMLNEARLKHMKKGVVLLNFSRENIVDTTALLTALSENKVLSYVTDFPAVELANHPKVICLPHLGASTKEAEENCAVMIVKQVREFLENGSITNSVNFPTLEMPRSMGATRLAIVNSNVPNMVAQMSSKLATAKLNILSLLNKSRDDIAYTLIDVNADVSDHLLKEINNIQGIIQVRKINPAT